MTERSDVESAAPKLGLEVKILEATSWDEINAPFKRLRANGSTPFTSAPTRFFYSYRDEIAALAVRHGLAAISGDRDFAQAGGLSGYGASRSDAP